MCVLAFASEREDLASTVVKPLLLVKIIKFTQDLRRKELCIRNNMLMHLKHVAHILRVRLWARPSS